MMLSSNKELSNEAIVCAQSLELVCGEKWVR